MRFLRWSGWLFGLLLLGLAALALAARFSDGPIGPFPGGPLVSGALIQGSEPDWSFAQDIPEMDLQLLDPPQSRRIWLLVHDTRLFAISGYMDTTLGKWWKQWPLRAEADGRAIVRIDGERYERRLERVRDPALFEALASEAKRKYGAPITAEVMSRGGAWVFELLPRDDTPPPPVVPASRVPGNV